MVNGLLASFYNANLYLNCPISISFLLVIVGLKQHGVTLQSAANGAEQ